MTTRSSARVPQGGSSRIRASKRDVSASRSRAFGASSAISNSSRQVATGGGAGGSGGRSAARVYLDGVDVTPQSLLVSRIQSSHEPRSTRQKGSKHGRNRGTRLPGGGGGGGGGGASHSVMGASVMLSQDQVSNSSVDDSSDGDLASPSPTTHRRKHRAAEPSGGLTGGGGKGGEGGASVPEDDDKTQTTESPGISSAGGGTSNAGSGISNSLRTLEEPSRLKQDAPMASASSISVSGSATGRCVPRRAVTLELCETETDMLLEMRSVCVAADANALHASVAQRNRLYTDMCARKKGSDAFVEGRTQTLQLAQKVKEVMTAPPATRDSACMATDWDIYDCARAGEEEEEGEGGGEQEDAAGAIAGGGRATVTRGEGAATTSVEGTVEGAAGEGGGGRAAGGGGEGGVEGGTVLLKQQVEDIVDATMASPGCVLDVDGDIVDDLRVRQRVQRQTRRHRPGGGGGGGGAGGSSYATASSLSSGNGNSQKSRVFVSGGSSAMPLISARGGGGGSGSGSSASVASPSQSATNVSFGASQDIAGLGGAGGGGGGGGEDSNNSVPAGSQIGISGGASQVLSAGAGATGSGLGGADAHHHSVYARANTAVDLGVTIAQQRTARVLASSALLRTVGIVERAVQQNAFHAQHVLYRNFPLLTASAGAEREGGGRGGGGSRRGGEGADQDWRASIGLADHESSTPAPSTLNGSTHTHALSGELAPQQQQQQAPVGLGLDLHLDLPRGAGSSPRRSGGGHALQKLWTFRCELTEDRVVTCLAWNTANEDLLAVSYAHSRPSARSSPPSSSSPAVSTTGLDAAMGSPPTVNETGEENSDGLVLFWSLKNPEFPERIYNLPAGVTSLAFSRALPYLLAVGFCNGIVAIYDTRKTSPPTAVPTPASTGSASPSAPPVPSSSSAPAPPRQYVPVPVATSETSPGKHLDAVWQVKWLSKGSDRGEKENVVSISSDGRVTEWSLQKGLSYTDLMTLKRVTNPMLGSEARGDGGVISRQASGHCIDFATHDPSVYFVGTEDGVIHKCSVSYNEQYLQSYVGHTGPVYELVMSPFARDLFLTCSADWQVKLWHQDHPASAQLTFRSVDLHHAVLSVSWSPRRATVFGTATEDGRIEIWDLERSSLDPIITHYPIRSATKTAASTRGATPAASATTTTTITAKEEEREEEEDVRLHDADLLHTAGKDEGVTKNTAPGSTKGVGQTTSNTTTAAAAAAMTRAKAKLECTKLAFAPSAPVIVVGDSMGDVTVYRVPALAEAVGAQECSVEEQAARLHRAVHPNKLGEAATPA